MKKSIILFLLIYTSIGLSQALPANRYYPNKSIIDLKNNKPSFAYSLRKLRIDYAGFAFLARRATNNAEANVAFDTNGVVSTSSIVTITAVGTSGFTIGQTMDYATFITSQTIHVKTWYDQGLNGFHATQPAATAQPIIQLNTAGTGGNTLPSIVYDGNRNLVVNQPIDKLVLNGVNGTFMLVTKHTSNTTQQSSFGRQNGSGLRWAVHLNWNDNFAYFDAAENCCTIRRFQNNGNINLYKVYTFIRGTLYKSIFVNSVPTIVYNSVLSTGTTDIGAVGSFGIGNWNSNTSSDGYRGNLCEIIMFPKDYSQAVIKFLETNQIAFWGL